ncbi:MAG: AraC family transcriptional regulator [Bacilli bacterium]|nr:AraC family transcriptional regulator [Bacilli bacterium]
MKDKYFTFKIERSEDLTYFNYRDNDNMDSPLFPIHIESVGKTFPDPQYCIKRANWDIYTIEFVVSGQGYLIVDGVNHHVKKGDLYILNKKNVQHYGADRDDPYEKIWINFRSDTFDYLLKIFNLEDVHVIHFPEGEYFLSQLYELKNSYFCVEDASFPALNILFNLLFEISKQQKEQADNVPPLIKKAAEYIDTKLMEPINVAEIAKEMNISQPSLINSFKKYYKKTPYDYQLSKRLNNAYAYIKTSNKPLSEIADICGFYDAFSLSKAFKKKYGVSPKEVRGKR